MKRGCGSPAPELVKFFPEMERDFLKNTKKLNSDERSLMFWGAIRSDGRKLLVKCPNKLNAIGYLEILKIYEEKMHFLDLIFQQDNAHVHKSKIIGNFFQENEWEVLEWPAYSPDLNSIENLRVIWKQRLRKQQVFVGKF